RGVGTSPGGAPAGAGARLRLAAARAAVGRLLERTRQLDGTDAPDLVVAAGGAWTVAPGPAGALAMAGGRPRAAPLAMALDHARLLGPFGAIPDAGERRALLIDIVDD